VRRAEVALKGLLRRCEKCGSYTFKEACNRCGGRTVLAHPPKFSPQDKYLKLRMQGLIKKSSDE
jgi:H/ACA ribonucleoprotein complex subunit 3